MTDKSKSAKAGPNQRRIDIKWRWFVAPDGVKEMYVGEVVRCLECGAVAMNEGPSLCECVSGYGLGVYGLIRVEGNPQ